MIRRKRLLILVTLLLTLGATGAYAWFSATGTGTARASAGTLTSPTGVTASANGSTVHVSFTAPASPSVAPTGYHVTRSDGSTTSAACGSSGGSPLTATATGCDDTVVPSGKYTYTVTAVYRTWTAASASSNSVTVAALDHFSVSAPASAIAGVPFTATVTARDASDNTITTYTGTVHLASSDRGSPALPSDYTFVSGDGGNHTFTNGVTLTTTPSQTVTVNDTVETSKSGQATVTVNPAPAATLVVSGYPSSTVAGVSHVLTVTAKDPFGNTDGNYAGTVHFTATGDAGAVVPANSTLTAGSGSFSTTFKTVAGGSKTLTVTDTVSASITGSQSGITVTPATASTLTVAGFPASTAGVAGAFSVTARDAFANTATGYTGTVQFASSDGQATLPANYSFLSGDAGTRSFSATLKTAGTQSIRATDTVTASITGSQSGIAVTGATASKLVFTTAPQTLTAGVSSGTITVQRQDPFNNPAAGGKLTVNLSTSGTAGGTFRDATDATPISSIDITGGASSASFRYRDSVAGSPTITGANGSLTPATQVETVVGAPATQLVFTTGTQTLTAGVTSGTITVQRQDQFNNPTAVGSTVVALTSTSSGTFRDTSDTLTVNAVTISAGSSTGSFRYNDMTAGSPVITAAASGSGSVTQAETVNAAVATRLVFTSSTQAVVVGQATGTVAVERQDQFGNPTTMPAGAITVNLASSSTGGLFRNATDTATISTIQIASGATSAAFRYRDAQAGNPLITASSTGLTNASQTETVSKASTTTTVSSSANPSVVGQPVTLTATVAPVAPGAGTATGTVTFKDGATTICNTIALSGGSASCDTGSLTVGSHSAVTAVYSSDANFTASSSASFTQTVNRASTTTSLASSSNPSVFGGSVTLTATVAPVAPGAGTPTGTVAFSDGATTICSTAALGGGQATCTTSSLAAGSHAAITAVYSSDASFAASSSTSFSQTVSKADQTVSFSSAAPSGATVAGATYAATATATSGLTATLTVDASASSVCSISSGVVSFTAAGTCVLDANQAGNPNWNAALQVQQSFSVGRGDQTIGFATLANKTFDQGPITVSASASSGLTVRFGSTTPSVCSSGGTNGATITFLAVGTCTIAADQAGSVNWNAAPQVQQTFTVSKGNQAISITSTVPAGAKVSGASYTPTANATSGLTVSFTIDATASSVCSISAGVVSFQTVGTCKVNANQAGSGTWNAAPQVQQSFAVAKGDQTITFPTLSAKTFDQGPITVSATASSTLAVTFASATTSVCTVSGSTVSFVTVGTCTINATQAGDTNWNAATPVPQSFTISKGTQTISFAALSDRRLDQSPLTVSATAFSGLTVAFSSATTTVCTVSGTTVTLVKAGTCTINANQAGDTRWNAASQVQQSFTVSKGNQTITFGALSNRRLDQSPLTIAATASSPLTISFSSATTGICTVAGSSVTLLHPGTCTINADQAGDSNWNAATQVTQSFTISKGNQIVSFGTAPAEALTAVAGSSVSASASSLLAVAFASSTSSICTVNGSSGALTLLTMGLCSISGDQGGNADWNAAAQATQSFQVYNGAVAGLIFSNVTVAGSSTTISCTTLGATYTCTTATGGSSNSTLAAKVAFANGSAVATPYSTVAQQISVVYTGKNAGTSPVNVAGGATSSTETAQVDRSGNGQAKITVTFTRPGGGTWTAVLQTP